MKWGFRARMQDGLRRCLTIPNTSAPERRIPLYRMSPVGRFSGKGRVGIEAGGAAVMRLLKK